MATTEPQLDVSMTDSTPAQPAPNPSPTQVEPRHQELEPKYGGFTRFEIELEFVQCLANPHYLLHLATLTTTTTPLPDISTLSLSLTPHVSIVPPSTSADSQSQSSTKTAPSSTPLLAHPPFIAYLSYLQYFSKPPYLKYLTYPGPTLKNLELLQSERFRREVLSPDVVGALVEEGRGAVAGGGGVSLSQG